MTDGPTPSQSDIESALETVDVSKRETLRKLVVGVFVIPVVASFAMSGLTTTALAGRNPNSNMLTPSRDALTADATVSACLIVRDEETFLVGCLSSLAGHVDEIVVVDTGSVDASLDIARRHGVVLLEREWRNDFAWARNEALAAARGEWVLYIDADERLIVPPGEQLTGGLRPPDVCAALVRFRPQPRTTPYREYRLFRNDPRVRFTGSMHEFIVPAIERLTKAGGQSSIAPAEIVRLRLRRRSCAQAPAQPAVAPCPPSPWSRAAAIIGGTCR